MKKLLVMLALMMPLTAEASTHITIDKSTQTMTVESNGASYRWPVSTARRGYNTPSGTYRPYSLQPMHYSRKYDNAPMWNSIFFTGGYAIHGTENVNALGHTASHGCVRLSRSNARTLFDIVSKDKNDTTITIR